MPLVAWDTKDTKCSDEEKRSVHLYRAPAPITLGKQPLLRQATGTAGRVARKSGFVSAGEEQQQTEHSQVAIICGEGLPELLSGSETLVRVVCEKTVSPQTAVKQIPLPPNKAHFPVISS